ncbi:hypothetical protein [Bacillus sp. EAC]|uniref:hypothetical protein n=1 Tax=Bacillus sp. EAC TaxID=1978338 RepID=UPI000B44D566|nr:hypothetical protein [Bacillus sp. EAC]
MNNYYKLAFFWVLQVVSCVLYFNFSLTIPAIFFTAVFIISAIVFSLTSTLLSFTYYVTVTLISAFYYLYLALSEGWTPAEQENHIIAHFISIISLFILFISSYFFKKIAKENKTLSNELKELEEFIVNTKVLSQREFEKRSEIILNGMKRRNESGYLISIDLSRFKKSIQQSIFFDLSEVALNSVRDQYDLVGQFESDKVKILLQNTSEDGLSLVLNRILTNMNKKIDSKMNELLIIETTQI